MSSGTTTYEVRLRYLVENEGTKRKLGEIQEALASTGRASNGLQSTLTRAGAALGAYFGAQQLKRSLIDFNSDLEQTKITMAGLLQMNVGGEFADSMKQSEELVGRLQQRAKQSVGTTKEFAQMASMLMQPLTKVGATMQEIEDLTVGSAVGARAMGIAADVAARDVDQALRGQFHSVDQFTGKLLGKEFGGEEGRSRFNRLTEEQRFQKLKEALNQKALKDMANAQEASFAGVISTLQDNLEMTFGKIGLPLFKAITREVERWNHWIDANGDRIASMAKELGAGLTTAFTVLKDVATFFYDNRETLMMLAKAWVAVKVGGMASSLATGVMGAGANIASGLGAALGPAGVGGSLMGAGATITRWLGPAGLVVGALAGFVGEVEALRFHEAQVRAPITDMATKFTQGREFLNKGRQDVDLDAFNEVAKKLATFSKEQGLLKEDLSGFKQEFITGGLLDQALTNMHFKSDVDYAAVANAVKALKDDVMAGQVNLRAILGEPAREATDAAIAKSKPVVPKVNVTINRIEVASDDPDRFVFGMVSSFQDLAKNPGAAARTLREG